MGEKNLFKLEYQPYDIKKESKEILICGESLNLTFDDLVKIYIRPIKKEIKKWLDYYEYDELMQICLIKLYFMYRKYDIKTGYNFGTMNGKSFKFAIIDFHNKELRYSQNTISYDNKINDDDFSLDKILGFEEIEIQNYEDKVLLSKILKQLSENERKQLIDIVCEKKSLVQVGNEKNKAKVSIYFQHQKILDKLRKMYLKEVQYA